MNIPVVKINTFGCYGDINIAIREQVTDDLANYIRHKISNEFMGSVASNTTIRAIQTFIDGELLLMVHNGQVRKDGDTWAICDYKGLWV